MKGKKRVKIDMSLYSEIKKNINNEEITTYLEEINKSNLSNESIISKRQDIILQEMVNQMRANNMILLEINKDKLGG